MTPSDADRLAALERAVAELQAEVRALRASPAAPPAAAAPRPAFGARARAYLRAQARGLGFRSAAPAADVEALVGRYATVAVATLLILTGVGAFLTWAVDRITITPPARVAMGAVLAGVLAAGGWRLRTAGGTADASDGTRRFGDLLLALALAVTHVDAWAAGPFLGLVPPAVALAVAAGASGALTALAWRARQQPLFLVGIGGALAAPFVTGMAHGRPLPLLAYGMVVLAAGAAALPSTRHSDPQWRWAARLLAFGGAVYTAQLVDDVGRGHPSVPGLLPIASAAFALAVPRRRRVTDPTTLFAALALAYLAGAAVALLAVATSVTHAHYELVALAALATGLVFVATQALTLADSTAPAPRIRIAGPFVRITGSTTALVLPLALLGAALLALSTVSGVPGASAAAAWAAAVGLVAWRTWARSQRQPTPALAPLAASHVAVAGLASAAAVLIALPGTDVLRVVLLAAHAAGAVQLFRVVRRPVVLLAPAVVASVAAAWAGVLLVDRPSYAYLPFVTRESLAAGATVAAWCALAWRTWRDGPSVLSPTDRRLAIGGAAVVTLAWGHQELARAVSPDVSTFLVIGYFALTGLAAIAVGRARALRPARQAGLALALFAALKAFAQASTLDSVLLRVGSYLLVGGFLLGVGYWYRGAPADRPAAPV